MPIIGAHFFDMKAGSPHMNNLICQEVVNLCQVLLPPFLLPPSSFLPDKFTNQNVPPLLSPKTRDDLPRWKVHKPQLVGKFELQ